LCNTQPGGGVLQGQAFKPNFVEQYDGGEAAQPFPVAGRWKDEAIDCFSDCSWVGAVCFYAYFMPRYLGKVHDRLEGRIGGDPLSSRYLPLTFVWLLCLVPAVGALWSLGNFLACACILACLVYRTRRLVRRRYAIPNSCCGSSMPSSSNNNTITTNSNIGVNENNSSSSLDLEDCSMSFFCTCCTVLQMYRHTKDSIDTAKAYRARIESAGMIPPDDDFNFDADAAAAFVRPGKMDPAFVEKPPKIQQQSLL